MDARAKSVREILHSGDQYLIPFFQRFYSWRRNDWKRLLEDLLALIEAEDEATHFLGPLVCTPTNHVPGEVSAYQLIDGQQRLTTLTLALAALRQLAMEAGQTDLAEEITEDYLIHKRKKGLHRYKVVPRIGDRDALHAIVDQKDLDTFKDYTVAKCHRFYLRELRRTKPADSPDWLQRAFRAITAQMSLVVITITEENPYEIFESLNSKGLPLEQSDLIRNFVFMHVPLSNQEEFYSEVWEPFESMFGASGEEPALDVTSYYRDYLMREGSYSKKRSTYVDFKRQYRARTLDPKDQVSELTEYARYEVWLRRPETCPDSSLRAKIQDLRRLEVTTAHPLLLHLLQKRVSGTLASGEFDQCLLDLQSFVIRRSVTGESTRAYGRWFPDAIRSLEDSPVQDLRGYWKQRGWPGDAQFTSALVEFQLYRREPRKCRLMLDRLEGSYGHKEKVDPTTLTIEHVLPQTLGEGKSGNIWRQSLGPRWFELHQQWAHTLGNLTLTGYNPDMQNREFAKKRPNLVASNLVLNSYFAAVDDWNTHQIQERGAKLASEIAGLWSNPTRAQSEDLMAPRGRDGKGTIPGFDIAGLRSASLKRIEAHLGAEAAQEGEARFAIANGTTHFLCSASQPYRSSGADTYYWFGVTPAQMDFLCGARDAYVALCCGSPDQILWFPLDVFRSFARHMNETEGRHWHIQVWWGDRVLMDQPKLSLKAEVQSYLLPLESREAGGWASTGVD